MISSDQAVAIASEKKRGQEVGRVLAYGNEGFVVTFRGEDPYANLPVYVDANTGEAQSLGASEYAKLLPNLTIV